MILDHIGVVVPSLTDGMRQWECSFGYRKNSQIVVNSRQKVRVVFLHKQNSITIKLLEPVGDVSPVSAVARKGGGLHHLCFRCLDMPSQIASLRSLGAVLMVPPEPGEAFNGKDIAFLMAKGNLNIELISTTEKAGWGDP